MNKACRARRGPLGCTNGMAWVSIEQENYSGWNKWDVEGRSDAVYDAFTGAMPNRDIFQNRKR